MVGFQRVYVDASIVVRLALKQPGALYNVKWSFGVSSELISVEVLRVLDHLHVTRRPPAEEMALFREHADANLKRLHLVQLDSMVLSRAGAAFSAPVGTLDAIHLATALLWMESEGTPLTFLTHDRQLSNAARTCGLQVYPV